MNETKPKKMVSRNVAIALGIICVIVAVGLIGALANNVTIMNSEIADKDETISQLQSQIAGLIIQMKNLTLIVNMQGSASWATNLSLDNQSESWETTKLANYSGYVAVEALSSSAFNVSVELSYFSMYALLYDRTAYIGSETPYLINSAGNYTYEEGDWFPILPSEVTVTVNNLPPLSSVTLSITYFY